jgi:hypothetical protein
MRALLVFLLSVCVASAKAQYQLTVLENQTYTEITNPTFEIPDNSQFWGNVTTKGNINFNAFGSSYELTNNNVFIPLKQGYAYFTNNSRSTTLYAARGEFDGRNGNNGTSVFSFANETIGGEQVFKMQWKNVGFENQDSTNYINFQLWLYESSGIIEMRYGAMNVAANIWETGANGPIVGLLEMDNSFNTIFNRTWLTGNAQSPVETKTGTFLHLDNTPKEGTVYKFTPQTTSVNEVSSFNNYKVYPTVIEEQNTLKVEQLSQCNSAQTLKVYNTLGKVILEEILTNTTQLIQLPEIESGFYYVSIEKEGKVLGTTKLIKK